MKNKGIIFDIVRASTVDGPGIRTSVFFKGCNLSCKWCHNPESQSYKKQMMFYKNKCSGCGKCMQVCPNNLEKCDFCGRCELFCPNDARKICGKEYTVDEVFDEVIKDKTFYDNSGGGVTFSGGECMEQIDFLEEILKKCRENGIHTAVDTAGHEAWKKFERIIPYTNLFLYDVKCISEDMHKKWVGVSNRLILENIKKLSKKSDIIVRTPVIPAFNDNDEEIKRILYFLKENNIHKSELLGYHKLGESKYEALGRKCISFGEVDKENMNRYKAMAKEILG